MILPSEGKGRGERNKGKMSFKEMRAIISVYRFCGTYTIDFNTRLLGIVQIHQGLEEREEKYEKGRM